MPSSHLVLLNKKCRIFLKAWRSGVTSIKMFTPLFVIHFILSEFYLQPISYFRPASIWGRFGALILDSCGNWSHRILEKSVWMTVPMIFPYFVFANTSSVVIHWRVQLCCVTSARILTGEVYFPSLWLDHPKFCIWVCLSIHSLNLSTLFTITVSHVCDHF